MNIQQFDYSINLLQAILWQYNDATNLQEILKKEQEFYEENYSAFWANWYANVFNLQTANQFGLYVWSIILNLPIQLNPPAPEDQSIWGFGPYRENFENGNFAANSSSIGLSLEEQRLVLKLRYYKLVSNGSIPDANRFFQFAFQGFGICYIVDNLNMSISVFFGFEISEVLLTFIKQYDLVPRDTGIDIKFFYIDQPVWGFGPYRKNFENGNFIGEL